MSSTSTNKQPALIDRPFLRGARLTSSSATIVDPTNPTFSNLIQVVRVGDLPSEDAALVEDLFLVSQETFGDSTQSAKRTAEFGVYVYAPNQASPSTSAPLQIAQIEVNLSGGLNGIIQRLELPKTNAPVPGFGDASLTGRPIELGASEGLYLEKGYILCVGYLGAGNSTGSRYGSASGLSPSGVTVFAQGGFY